MSWLAGETKWWLILAAVIGFALTMLFQLVRVKVRDTRAVSGSGSLGGSVKDKIDFGKPDLDKPSLDKHDQPFSGTLPEQAGDPEPDARTIIREPEARTVIREPEPTPSPSPEAAAAPAGRFGPGSVDADGDGTSPTAGYAIKGNADSMKFHTTDSPYYGRTRAEVWFDTEESARRAGFHRWDEKGPSAGSHRSGV